MRASVRRGSRITSRRAYVRDERGRFAHTPGSSDADTADDSAPKVSTGKATAVKAAGIAGVVIAATAAGTAVAATTYRRDTAALVAAYKSALAAEQMDHRVERLLDKHRAQRRTTATRRTR